MGLLVVTGCRKPRSTAESFSSDGAKNSACVTDYDADIDYFPHKVQPEYATGFSVDYYNHYKLVTVLQPWQAAEKTFEYLLVQCGTPTPEGFEDTPVIQIPISTIVTLSTTYLPHLEKLDQLDTLLGMDNFSFVYTPDVRKKIEQGELIEFSSGNTLDIERLLLSEPDLIMAYGTGNPDIDSYSRLTQAGLPVTLVGDYVENSPLGRAEWLLFTALFFNQEAKAQTAFTEISTDYESLAALTAQRTDRPSTFSGFSYEGTWYTPGGESYAAQLLRDSGAA